MAWSKEVFSKNLRYYMESRGKTQKELAEIVGVSAPTVNEWLKGKKFPRIDKIELMSNYFGILKSDLIEDKAEKPTENSGLSEEKRELMAFVDSLPDEKVALALRLLKSI